MLGVFLTGSDTSSNTLFGPLQAMTARVSPARGRDKLLLMASSTWWARMWGGEGPVRLANAVLGGLAILFIVLGLIGFRAGGRVLFSASVNGQIVSSRVNEYNDKQGARQYRPMVIFSYPVGAERYMSNRVASGGFGPTSRAAAERTVARYPVGRTVTVFYDPLDPQHAVLEPGTNPWLFIALGGVCAISTVVLRQYHARKKRARTARGG
jgi:hypothetical protein